ncbi:putative iron-sulfur cluster-binding metallochaperone [Deinococcus deserti]|uniref:CopZ zinc binding domain-containing protein n=1 Tax=Deinococcus deserti (strain DSM 17065 / CIP 109153 / LMG 22923 / VCD115) TaxID=546414 RepID=C1D416_DEIDV|nr:copper chaperone Copz family protein [Deinococcus deserti]ACO48245.1 hypothetical protein Deide_3p02772 [Deinococcus deserti VCD115]
MASSGCCAPEPGLSTLPICPTCGTTGRTVKLITLKALLRPPALATLDPNRIYRFCPNSGCEVVYFFDLFVYVRADVKVPVFQKDQATDTPVCYCFGLTRGDLSAATQGGLPETISSTIQAHIKAGRCGCEVNNPQGKCCLGDIYKTLSALQQASERRGPSRLP